MGTQQLVLADQPAAVTERRLADRLLESAGWRVIASVVSLLGSIVTALFVDASFESEVGAVGVATVASLAFAWPILKPLIEIQQLGDMSAEKIEETVSVKEPLGPETSGRLPGEDALLDWPGGQEALLEERDDFMTRAVALSVIGKICLNANFIDEMTVV